MTAQKGGRFGLGRAGRKKVSNEVGYVHALFCCFVSETGLMKSIRFSLGGWVGREEIPYHSYEGRTEMEEMGKL